MALTSHPHPELRLKKCRHTFAVLLDLHDMLQGEIYLYLTCVLYTLREEHRRRAFENRVLRERYVLRDKK